VLLSPSAIALGFLDLMPSHSPIVFGYGSALRAEVTITGFDYPANSEVEANLRGGNVFASVKSPSPSALAPSFLMVR
jgi:hypothetical protein